MATPLYAPLLEGSGGPPSPSGAAERGERGGSIPTSTTLGDRVRSWASLRGDASPTYARSARPPSGYGGFGDGRGGGDGRASVFGSYGDDGDRRLGSGGGGDAPAFGRAPKLTLGVRDTRGR